MQQGRTSGACAACQQRHTRCSYACGACHPSPPSHSERRQPAADPSPCGSGLKSDLQASAALVVRMMPRQADPKLTMANNFYDGVISPELRWLETLPRCSAAHQGQPFMRASFGHSDQALVMLSCPFAAHARTEIRGHAVKSCS